jgi:DNA-binding MarR family transcriptional regulator
MVDAELDIVCICTYSPRMTTDHARPPPKMPVVLCHCSTLRTAARRATALYDSVMAPYGLRISQYGILVRLRRLGPMSLQSLAAEMVLDRTTMARNLAPLERDGLVTSEAEPRDRRVRRMSITKAGLALMQRAAPAWRAAQSTFETQYGVEAAMALRQDLHRLTASLGATTGIPEAE